jgi:hypothetical protein
VILDTLESWWNGLIELSAMFIIPDWGGLVGLLPILLLIGVVGPIVTLLALFWFRYIVRRPRAKRSFAEVRRAAPRDEAGNPVFPVGEPYSIREAVIYEPGSVRSDAGEELVVACPKCRLVRPASESTCGNCGLTFTLQPTTRSLKPAGPPPGGRAAA